MVIKFLNRTHSPHTCKWKLVVKTFFLCSLGPQNPSLSGFICPLECSEFSLSPKSSYIPPVLSLQIVDKQNVLWPCNPDPAMSKTRFPTPKTTLDYNSSLSVTGASSVTLWVCSLIGKKDVKTDSEEAWHYFIRV